MNRILSRYKHEVALFLLSSFLMAIGWSILCDLDVIYVPDHHGHNDVEEHAHPDHGHNHGHGNNQQDDDHHGQGDADDNCCEDLADNLFSAISDHNPIQYSFINIFFVQSFNNTDYLIRIIHPRIKRIIVLTDLPPPKVPDIRIFIQSFLN